MSQSQQDQQRSHEADEWAFMTRLERKRHQEKRRRQEFKEALENLLVTLLTNDDDFQREARLRETRMTGKVFSSTNVNLEGENALFNRVELVNQASFTVDRLSRENKELKTMIADFKQRRGFSGLVTHGQQSASTARTRSVFHQGIGPVEAEQQDADQTDSAAAASSAQEETGTSLGRSSTSKKGLLAAISDIPVPCGSAITTPVTIQDQFLLRQQQQRFLLEWRQYQHLQSTIELMLSARAGLGGSRNILSQEQIPAGLVGLPTAYPNLGPQVPHLDLRSRHVVNPDLVHRPLASPSLESGSHEEEVKSETRKRRRDDS